jgi:chaperonin GroEL
MEKFTNDGVITVEESKTMDTNLSWLKACSMTEHISAYMITDTEKMEAVLVDPIYDTDKKINKNRTIASA